jgi:hypothetical protein
MFATWWVKKKPILPTNMRQNMRMIELRRSFGRIRMSYLDYFIDDAVYIGEFVI